MTTSSIASSSRSSTALVMMDTRPAQIAADSPASNLDYPQLAFELNRGYACRHGYDLLYLRMQSATCEHELLGERHPSYCKLAAVAEALHRGYSLVALLDSDAFVRNLSLSLPQLLSVHRGSRLGGGTSAEPADVSFGVDQPFSFGPNGGVQFWRNTPTAARLLRLWWHLPGGRYHLQHDFEQHALQWSLLQLRAFRAAIETLQLQATAAAAPAAAPAPARPPLLLSLLMATTLATAANALATHTYLHLLHRSRRRPWRPRSTSAAGRTTRTPCGTSTTAGSSTATCSWRSSCSGGRDCRQSCRHRS